MKNSLNRRLIQQAETAQEEADYIAFHMVKLQEKMYLLSSVQSVCEFNLFWLYQVSDVIIYDRTLEFILNHKTEFKRKLTISEMIEFDWIIAHNDLTDFEDFRSHLVRSRKRTSEVNIYPKHNRIISKQLKTKIA